MISDNKEARGDAAHFHIVLCSRKGRFPPQGRGAHSFLEKNPPHTPEEKHQGVSLKDFPREEDFNEVEPE